MVATTAAAGGKFGIKKTERGKEEEEIDKFDISKKIKLNTVRYRFEKRYSSMT